jgi:hypothetical protein
LFIMSKSSGMGLVVGSVVSLMIAATSIYYLNNKQKSKASSSSNTIDLRDIEDSEEEMKEEDMITVEEIVNIFDALFMELQGVFGQLMQQVQQIQMTGNVIPEKQLKGLIRAELQRALTVKQKLIIVDQYQMDMKCCEEATWEFIVQDQNPAVIKAVERFQKLWENATGDAVTGWIPGQTSKTDPSNMVPVRPEEIIEAAEIYFNALTDCMKQLVAEYQRNGKDLKNPMIQQELNMEFSMKISDVGEDALRHHMNMSLSQFEYHIKAHSGNPTVGQALGMLQIKQQQDLMSLVGGG